MNNQNKKIKLKHLLNTNCIDCELHRSSKHVCILGRGNLFAKIMLIGEAPGSAEELTGKPFCGRAGKLLNELLIDLSLQNSVYITNVCKCKPPDNRKPTDSEISVCQKYLAGELTVIKPKIIILLGKVAMSFVENSIGNRNFLNAGTNPFQIKNFYNLINVWIIPTWHPAYCLRRGTGATNDLRKALQFAKEVLWVKPNIY